MDVTLNLFPTIVFLLVMICWFVFAGTFIFWKKPPSPPDQKRERGSWLGVALQGVSFGLVWGVHRSAFTPIVEADSWQPVAFAAGVFAVIVAAGSVWLIRKAINTLGKEWSLTARVVEGHQLATSGPYAFVRHPIYSGMLGMLVATGLAISRWPALLVALVIFFIGTAIRVHSEEKLLREAFGEQFENYAQRVSAIVPGLY